MAMLVTWIIGIDKPFLQLSVTAHLHGRQTVDSAAQRITVSGIHSENLGSQHNVVHRVKRYLIVHRASC